MISNFTEDHSLIRCDELFPSEDRPTYVNLALNQQSRIDYILASPGCQINNFSIIDPTINFSDHLPLLATAVCHTSAPHVKTANKPCPVQNQLWWDQADLISYYFCTGNLLGPPLTRLDEALLIYDNGNLTPGDVAVIVDEAYYDIVNILVSCAKNFVPECQKAFYKFWWDAELTSLKEAAVDADKLWKTAGKPRYGPIFDKRQTTRMHYRKRLRQGHNTATEYFTPINYTTRFSANRALPFGNAGNQNLTLEINVQRFMDVLMPIPLPTNVQLTLKNATHVTM